LDLSLISIKMTIKINKKHQKEIAKIKEIIEKNRQEEDKLILKLFDSMNLEKEAEQDIIWDHIYNESDWMVEKE